MTAFATENKVACVCFVCCFATDRKAKKAYTIGQEMLMSVMKEIVKPMIEEMESKDWIRSFCQITQ